jgi:formylglycine-generating enzyme required for sulfatase activity
MSDGVSMQPAAWGQVRVNEPAGERILPESLAIGGSGADVVVPGVEAGAALTITRRAGLWLAEARPGALVRFNGRPLGTARDLRRNDVLALGDAQVSVAAATRTLLKLDVTHLAGNVTIAPTAAFAVLPAAGAGDEDLEIRVPAGAGQPAAAPPRARHTLFLWLALAAALLAALVLYALRLQSVVLDLEPRDARVAARGTFSLQLPGRLLVWPGERQLRIAREGYASRETSLLVPADAGATLHVVLDKLPGVLHIDTGGVVTRVSVDGVAAGLAPGEVHVPAGTRTLTLSAPRYVDYTTTLAVAGGGARQELRVQLTPSWGRLNITSSPEGAHVSIDGADSGTTPLSAEVGSGVRHLRIAGSGWQPWESSVVLRGGETLSVGPVALGAPDAHLVVRSQPSGAEVTVAGVHRGVTPLELDLPAGISYPVVLTLAGHAPVTREVFASSGARLLTEAQLAAVLAKVSVSGEPADAQLFVDGAAQGATPQTLTLPAIEHRLEVRRAGYEPYSALVTPEAGLERALHYHLVPADRARALEETAPLIRAGGGYALRLVPGGSFAMGGAGQARQVTLARPLYLGVRVVSNAEFRRFSPGHLSGYLGRVSLDLDDQPVTHVTWEEAAEYCNWLSRQDGLPPAYEAAGDSYVLTHPVTRGYRLPSEAEWEYAARYAAPGRFTRYTWGDSLPVPADAGNLAGAESALSPRLAGYRDDYPVLAPAGRFRATALGLTDMSGNVSQWMNDSFAALTPAAALTDPLGPQGGTRHVVRGANWRTAADEQLLLSWREGAEAASSVIGFRLARYADDPAN